MSQVATYRDKRQVIAKAYAPGGCPVHLGKQKCGETQGLNIIMDFHKLYQEKISEIDVSAGGDSLQEKVSLQEQWINDLTEQNKLLAKVIEELESETIGRVQQLEDKLNNAVKSIGEDDKPALPEKKKIEEPVPPLEEDLKKKTEENDRLKQGMEEMRVALTEEIANKHDAIALLQSEIYQLEEKNSEIMKETSIKDDIIKELRKELKKSKQKGHQLKQLEGKLPVIVEVSEQEIVSNESVDDVQTKDQATENEPEDQSEKEIKLHSMSKPEIELKEDAKPKPPPKKTKTPESSVAGDENDKLTEVLMAPQDSSLPPSSKAPSTSLLFGHDEPEDYAHMPYHKERGTSKVSSRRSVHLMLDDETNEVVEPGRDRSASLDIPSPPKTESLPMMGTTDSLELIRMSSHASEKPPAGDVCVCVEQDFWDELTQLREENRILKKGSELQRMKREVEEKMKRILELNEENRTLNEMINMLRNNQTGKKQIDRPSDSEPMSSDSDYCTGGCEPTRSPIKPSSARRRLSGREKAAAKPSAQMCLCVEDKYDESPPFIDVYKREDKGKFVSDSSSTVCNEDMCVFIQPLEYRARGGYDCNDCTDCACPPLGAPLPNFQVGAVCEECDDSSCPLRDCSATCGGGEEVLVGVDDFGGECDDRTCPQKDFQDQGVQSFPQGGGAPAGPSAPAVPPAGSNAPFPITCTDDTCQSAECSAKMGDAMPQSYGPVSDFPITCDDDTCQVPDCPAKIGDAAPPQPTYVPQQAGPQQVGPQQDAGVSCDDARDCSCVNQGSYPMQIDPKCACLSGMGPTQAAPSAAAGVPKTPSECICTVPEECQSGGGPGQPPTRSGDGKCPRGTCETCVCTLFPLPDANMHFGVPPPSGGGGGGGQCPRGICEQCACMHFPGVKAGGGTRPIAALPVGVAAVAASDSCDKCAICGCQLTSSDIMVGGEVCGPGPSGAPAKAAAVGPITSTPCPDEICTEPCSCKAVYSDTGPIGVAGPIGGAVSIGGAAPTRRIVSPAGGVGPLTANPCPDEICPEPCNCKVTQSEPYIDPDDPEPVRGVSPAGGFPPAPGGATGAGGSCDPCSPCVCGDEGGVSGVTAGPARPVSAGTAGTAGKGAVAPITENLCPDEICEKPCVCKVVPSEGYIDSDTDMRRQQKPGGTATQTGVMPMASEACSVVCAETTVQATMTEPRVGTDAATGTGGPDDGVCGDSTCSRRYPKGGTASTSSSPSSKPRPPPPGGDDGSVISCTCQSKYCTLVPDPNHPGRQMCVDRTDVSPGQDDACVCASCPDATQTNPPEGSICADAPDDKSSQVPTQPPVMTVNQVYRVTKAPESLSKEQEYAGVSRKDSLTRRTGYIAPRKALSTFGIQDVDDDELAGNDEMRNADLKLIIAELKGKLLDAEDRIEELKLALISKYSEQINEMKKSIKWTKKEREEYEYLKQRVKLLEQGKGDTEHITTNLQTAVDLYVDTIEVLEASEEKLKAEIEHYKSVNEVLHENVLNLREEIETMKETFQQELDDLKWINFISLIENDDIQHTNEIYLQQVNKYQNLYQEMMELNYKLEMEHFNNLQDLSMMEAQFNKYQSVFKTQEEDKIVIRNQLKKLTKKNKCYEEVVQFFKEEMSVMSDELLTLQEVLNVTSVSSQEENNKLIGAILQLRRINDRLVAHLYAIEKQAILESQINQINEARINELQSIISAKNNDLTQHDDIIHDMRRKLNNATSQNADLKKTIKNLTDTVVEIQEGIKSVEREQQKNVSDVSVVESKVCLASGDLESIKTCMEQKNSRIIELENQLKSQEVDLILATKELGMLKEKKADSKEIINSLKEQLSSAEKKNEQVVGDYQIVVKKLQDYSNLEHMKNYELNHYKSLVEEMKTSLGQLNNGLEKCEASNIHFYEDLRNSDHMRGRLQHRRNNLPIVFDELKKSMADLKRRLSEADFKGGLIEEELLKVKESHMSQITEEVTDTQKELEAKIISSIEEQSRLNQVVEDQKEEIARLKRELEKEKAEICCCKRSVSDLKNEKTSSNAEVEITQLKGDLNKSLHRQRLLNEENDQIHTQMINLRKKLTFLEQAYDVLKQENEDYKTQLKRAMREKEYLSSKNHDLTKTIEQMRSTHDQLEKQCRYKSDRLRNLELELADIKADREIASDEAKHLASVVKTWIEEEPNENVEIRGKFKNNSDTIAPLRQTMMKKMSEEKSWISTPMQQPFSPRRYGTVGHLERRTTSPVRTRRLERHTADARYRSSSPWHEMSSYDEYKADDTNSHRSNLMRNISYDSNSSPYTSRSPSPRSNSIQGEEDEMDEMNLNDWFSPNYKETETDADEGDEDSYINKVQLMTAQVQEANIRWQKKMNKDHLSKSRASNM